MKQPVIEIDLARKKELAKLTNEVQEFEILNYFLGENIEHGEITVLLDIATKLETLRENMLSRLAELESILANSGSQDLTDEIARFLDRTNVEESAKQRILAAISRMGGVSAAVTTARTELEGFAEPHATLLKSLRANARPSSAGITNFSLVGCSVACGLLVLGIVECLPCGVAGAVLGANHCFNP